MNKTTKITFSFGKNWSDYSSLIDTEAIQSAKDDILKFIPNERISGKKIIDIGSGSGIHSLAFLELGAASVFSFDYDINSVNTTIKTREKFEKNSDWQIEQGSILDLDYVKDLSEFDIVYSWGVLHHTGNMWEAIKNASILVKKGGLFFISIYAKGPNYNSHLNLKIKYNNSSKFGKKVLINIEIAKFMWRLLKKRRNPFNWNKKLDRGMNRYYDIVDWLGGYPYEVANIDEIHEFIGKENFKLFSYLERKEGSCHRICFEKVK